MTVGSVDRTQLHPECNKEVKEPFPVISPNDITVKHYRTKCMMGKTECQYQRENVKTIRTIILEYVVCVKVFDV